MISLFESKVIVKSKLQLRDRYVKHPSGAVAKHCEAVLS